MDKQHNPVLAALDAQRKLYETLETMRSRARTQADSLLIAQLQEEYEAVRTEFRRQEEQWSQFADGVIQDVAGLEAQLKPLPGLHPQGVPPTSEATLPASGVFLLGALLRLPEGAEITVDGLAPLPTDKTAGPHRVVVQDGHGQNVTLLASWAMLGELLDAISFYMASTDPGRYSL